MLKDRPPRRIIIINGKSKYRSHVVWHANTGHWPKWPEVIHHIDDDTMNDDFANLQLMSNSEHSSMHNSGENNPAKRPEVRVKNSAAHMGENNPRWEGDEASDHALSLIHI